MKDFIQKLTDCDGKEKTIGDYSFKLVKALYDKSTESGCFHMEVTSKTKDVSKLVLLAPGVSDGENEYVMEPYAGTIYGKYKNDCYNLYDFRFLMFFSCRSV